MLFGFRNGRSIEFYKSGGKGQEIYGLRSAIRNPDNGSGSAFAEGDLDPWRYTIRCELADLVCLNASCQRQ
jgi:hypothetical protein